MVIEVYESKIYDFRMHSNINMEIEYRFEPIVGHRS